jgi:hypothetical protein
VGTTPICESAEEPCCAGPAPKRDNGLEICACRLFTLPISSLKRELRAAEARDGFDIRPLAIDEHLDAEAGQSYGRVEIP